MQLDERSDPWSGARDKAREDVVAALAPRERRCPACGHVQRGGGRRCESCGADLTARYPSGRSRRAWLFAAAVALALTIVAIPVVASLRGDAASEREQAERRQAERIAAERARQERDAEPVRAAGPALAAGTDPLAHRAQLVADAERRITEDARERVAAGTLDGDIKGAECSPYPATVGRRAAEDDPATPKGRYDCVAYTSKFEAPELEGKKRTGLFGHPYWLVIDYGTARMVWCKVTPRAGEGGSVLVTVPVPPPCRDPAGPG